MKLFHLNSDPHTLLHAVDYDRAAQCASKEGLNLHAGLVWAGMLLDGTGERVYRTVRDKDRLSNYPSASQVFFVRANSYGEAEKVFNTIADGAELSNITIYGCAILEDDDRNLMQKIADAIKTVT